MNGTNPLKFVEPDNCPKGSGVLCNDLWQDNIKRTSVCGDEIAEEVSFFQHFSHLRAEKRRKMPSRCTAHKRSIVGKQSEQIGRFGVSADKPELE